MERLTLLANHVIASEPVAQQRLLPHADRTFALQLIGWPSLLPAPPPLTFAVTPAGLLEWRGTDGPSLPDLRLMLDASNPMRSFGELLRGVRPRIDIDGDAGVAADLSWLMENLRWDVTDDLAKVIGPGPAHELSRVMRALSGGLKQAVDTLRTVASRIAAAVPDRTSRGEAGTLGPMRYVARLIVIALTVYRFGLDELLLSSMKRGWLRRLGRVLAFGRRLGRSAR